MEYQYQEQQRQRQQQHHELDEDGFDDYYHHPSSPPSVTSVSETPNASSDVSSPQLLPSQLPDTSVPAAAQLPSSPSSSSRNPRKLTINSDIARPPSAGHLIRRKPLSISASPIATRFSSGAYLSIVRDKARLEQRTSRSFSLDSPTVYGFEQASIIETVAGLSFPRAKVASIPKPKDDVRNSHKIESPVRSSSPSRSMSPEPSVIAGEEVKHPSLADHPNPAAPQTDLTAGLLQPSGQSSRDGSVAEPNTDEEDPLSVLDGYNTDSSYNTSSNNSNMSMPHSRKTPPQLALAQVDTDTRSTSISSPNDLKTPDTNKPLPKSPGSASKLGSFFGWGGQSPTTPESSDKESFSPIPPSTGFSRSNTLPNASPATLRQTTLLEAPLVSYNGSANPRDYVDSYLATPPPISAATTAEIEEMEDELKAISTELAASIRREMDLEDLVDRLQAERDNPTATANKRTSDYFSDSGYSSAKFSEYEQSRDEIEKIQRRSEQEKAQIRLELTQKVQDERLKRAELDGQIKELSERASQVDLAQINSMDASGRIQELENTCESLRRKLADERQIKDNFEDLLSALKGELENAANERDNLRDEIVPQLRARVDGLENQASELEKMNYEATKMQQELQALKSENTSLKEAGSKAAASMGSITEEDSFSAVPSRLTRSNSITGPPPTRKFSKSPGGLGLSRSKSVRTTESRDTTPNRLSITGPPSANAPSPLNLTDRLKDVEDQRDALHRALKALLERQEHQNRENEKKIKALEMERDRLLNSSPKKAGFAKEVSNLRDEINVLRRRSEEALEQKWQVEKGLAGLKMDLDRAEMEIASLRSLLQEKDILIPEAYLRHSGSSDGSIRPPVTSESLVTAYAELQDAYAQALGRVKELSTPQDEKTELAIERLEQSLSSTISDRDLAMQEAASFKAQLDMLKAGESAYLESEKALGDELSESARRVEELSTQVRQQLATNQNLRQRLSDTVARGDAAQRANAERIAALQDRLHMLEEQVVAAQTASEERVARHEDEIAAIKENQTGYLARLSSNPRSPRQFLPKSPMSPLFARASAKSFRLSTTRSGPAMSVSEETQVASLKEKVTELEKALTQADSEMEEVVGRMNAAQIEVLQLQEEREAAMSQTRKLERELQAEKVKAFEERFKSLQS
ncbi:hypothetical protein PFICI_00839 [Pestalotiopsis fici W106-1]|uniref:DUF7603 domain-containing protein n=1 Tax=Pestalotiopsis fici (strain W106-1 / CGMCC3.15140) TaxID=1229662 RepID=W3XP05_PESFW|nr:uncharacterized protein PFICI_00839 [Pestalotiopsis fici W106-1]ETS87011.1 hypothetical protein PFICI_00839 [Pestalotiopsis fici W106-1]